MTRVALVEGSLVVNSSQGGGSKDTWVIDDGETGDRFAAPEAGADTAWPAVPWPASPAPKRHNSPSAHDDRLIQQERQQQQGPAC